MIVYDSHRWSNFFQWYGSVLPCAGRYALVPGIVACIFKILDNEGVVEFSKWKLLNQTAPWSVFTGTVGFLLVFRTAQCYGRFVENASSVFKMKTQMMEACNSLNSFCCMSKASKEDLAAFKDKLIHLFSMLHACALASVAGSSHNRFKIIDIDSLPTRFVHALQEAQPQRRVDLTYQWINNLIVREIPTGLLNVPAPVLSRVFQELEKAMVEYNNLVQLMTVPFPFPYSQACVFLTFLHILGMPLVVVAWTEQAVAAGLFTFLSAACFLCLEMISAELENPFGDDANDLPVTDIHNEFNESLQLLLHPSLAENFTLKRHRRSDVVLEGGRSTWRELGELQAGDDENDFFTAENLDDEVCVPVSEVVREEEAGQQPNMPKAPAEAAVQGDADALPMAPPPSAEVDFPLKLPEDFLSVPDPSCNLSHLSCQAQPQSCSLPELPWISEFTQKQTKFEEDILKRLDDIVNALTTMSWSHMSRVPINGSTEKL